MAQEQAQPGRHTTRRPPAVVEGENVHVERVDGDVGVAEAKRRFGGVDVPATLAGMLAALGTALVIGSIFGAVGALAYEQGVRAADTVVAVIGLVAGLITLILAFLLGGWVAGRIARYDGGRNGLMTAVWFLILTIGLGALGAWAGTTTNMPARVAPGLWPPDEGWTTGAIVSGLVALAVMLGAGYLGGKLGERYHRRADALIAHTRPGGVHAGDRTRGAVRDSGATASTADDATPDRRRRDR